MIKKMDLESKSLSMAIGMLENGKMVLNMEKPLISVHFPNKLTKAIFNKEKDTEKANTFIVQVTYFKASGKMDSKKEMVL